MRNTFDTALPEDVFHEILGYFSYDYYADRETLLIGALVSRSWARMCRSRWTLELSSNNFQDLRVLLESPLSSFAWIRNLEVLVFPSILCGNIPVDWFHETVPYLAALKRVISLSLLYPPSFSNFDELLNVLCVFPSLQSVLLSGVEIYDWTWSPSRPGRCPSLSSITIRDRNPGIFLWLQSQDAIHAVCSFRATIMNAEDFELMGSFLQASAGTLQHLQISFESWNASERALPTTFSLVDYKNLQSLKLEDVQDPKFVPRVLKQITSPELKHLSFDWDLVYHRDSIPNNVPCDWSELGDILAGDQFSNLLMVEIQFYVNNVYDKRAIAETEAEIQRCMPSRDGCGFHQLKFKQLQVNSPNWGGCPSCDGIDYYGDWDYL